MSWICPTRIEWNCFRSWSLATRVRKPKRLRDPLIGGGDCPARSGLYLTSRRLEGTSFPYLDAQSPSQRFDGDWTLSRVAFIGSGSSMGCERHKPSGTVAATDGSAYDVSSQSKRRQRPHGARRRLRLQAAFSLVEVLASLLILTLSAGGITAAWRLADYQELLTRVDRRAERILRQYYELQTFAPPDSRPFTVNASAAQSPVTGYLYYPRLIANQTSSTPFGKLVPFSISLTNGTAPGTSQLVLIYTIPSFGTQASRQVTKTVVLNP
jgi:hypothetical protein